MPRLRANRTPYHLPCWPLVTPSVFARVGSSLAKTARAIGAPKLRRWDFDNCRMTRQVSKIAIEQVWASNLKG